jgi:hypothetical protein
VNYWLGVTDNGWFEFLSHQRPDEVNFRQPTTDLSIEISPRIREQWFNGKAYNRLHGQPLANVPSEAAHRPAPDFLRWHNDNRFQG